MNKPLTTDVMPSISITLAVSSINVRIDTHLYKLRDTRVRWRVFADGLLFFEDV